MKKILLAAAIAAATTGGAFAQANDTIAKVKASGVITMGVLDSAGDCVARKPDAANPPSTSTQKAAARTARRTSDSTTAHLTTA